MNYLTIYPAGPNSFRSGFDGKPAHEQPIGVASIFLLTKPQNPKVELFRKRPDKEQNKQRYFVAPKIQINNK
nr:hypothetical protein [uncultured Cohaesibacter sp.]